MATEFEVFLQGGSPWGFRLQGGREFRLPLKIAKVEPGGKADIAGVQAGDHVTEINEINTDSMYHTEALTAVKQARSTLSLVLNRPEGSQIVIKSQASTERAKPQHAAQSSTSSADNVPGGQGYMKKIFGSIDDLLNGYDDTTDLPPLERDRSKTLPKKLPARDTRLSSSASSGNSGSLPRTSSTSGAGGNAPNWYKQMYKEMHNSMEKESHLSKLLTCDAERGAFRKYDGASTVTEPAPRTTDHIPRRLAGGGRAAATNPHRKSLPNLHATNFNFMSASGTTKPTENTKTVEQKKEHRKSINSDWYKQLQKGGDIPEVGLAVKGQYKSTYTPPLSSNHTQKHTVTSPITKRASGKDQFVTKQPSVNIEYNRPQDFLELRKRELKNQELETEREVIRQRRESERVEEEDRLRKRKELDRKRIEEDELRKRENVLAQSKIEEMVSQEVEENRARYLNQSQEEEAPGKSVVNEIIDSVEIVPEMEEEPPEEMKEEPSEEMEEEKIVLAKSKYSFHPQGPGELDFKKGEVIRIIQQIDDNWFEGEIDGDVGIFPVSYVQIMEEKQKEIVLEQTKTIEKVDNHKSQLNNNNNLLKEVQTTNEKDMHVAIENIKTKNVKDEPVQNPAVLKIENKRGTGKAKYTFKAENENELSFRKGEMISLIRQIDDNWFEGEASNGDIGIFPVNYVQVLTNPSVNVPAEEVLDVSLNGYKEEEAVVQETINQQYQEPSPDINFEKLFEDVLQPTKNLLIEEDYEKKDREKQRSEEETTYLPNQQKTSNIDDLLGMGEMFRAVYSYAATNEDEVDLDIGDIVHVLEQCDDGWFVGTSQRTGAFGTFPGNYVVAC